MAGLGGAEVIHEHPYSMKNTENRTTEMLPTGGYLLANGVSREEADKMRLIYKSVVISRNTNGTYRVTRAGH